MATTDRLDAFGWVTSSSGTRLTSVSGFNRKNTIDLQAAGDLQGILHAIRQLHIPHVPYSELRALESIGQGVTFSVVKHLWKDRVVAIKYVRQCDTAEVQSQNVFRRRLKSALQEIMVMHHKPLASHPNIVKLLGCGWQRAREPPAPFIVVEFGSLGDLRAFLRSQKPWDVSKKLILGGDVAAGLMALHEAGIVHGDLKLDNILCFRTWSRPTACLAKLCDFSHSIVVTEPSKPVHYYGTPLYLPPEALVQHDRPISSEDVHKCDIWAFGLALWEILMDGDIYFQSSWSHDPQYSRRDSTGRPPDSALLSSPLQQPLPASALYSDRLDESFQRNQVFGDFDLSYLSALGCEAVNRLVQGIALPLGFARSYLRPLMRQTLDPDPTRRLSNMAGWPIVTDWQTNSSSVTLGPKLNFHTQTSELAFDIFRPDRQADIAWSMQVHMYHDLESILASRPRDQDLSRISLQLAFCWAFGFGCDIDLLTAATYLEAGLQHSPALAKFVGQALQASFEGNELIQPQPFADRASVVFASQWDIDLHSTVSLCWRITNMSLSDSEDLPETIRLETWSDLPQLLARAAEYSSKSTQTILLHSLVRYDDEAITLSWLELAILWDDHTFIDAHQSVLLTGDLNRIDSWTMSPLLLACVRGQAQTVRRFLHLGADPALTTPDGCNLLHFLFCLGAQAVDVLHEAVKLCPELINKVDLPCEKSFEIHSQWPTKIEGSPLAIAATVGHLPLAEALLKYRAASWRPAFTSKHQSRDYIWTPMHLAVKYNFYGLVMLFVNQSGSNSFGQNYKGDFPLASALSFLSTVERHGIHGPASKTALSTTVGLLQRKSFYSPNVEGMTAILQAIDFENYDVVRALLERYADLATEKIPSPKNPSDFTMPLHFACQICARKDVQYVLRIPREIVSVRKKSLKMTDNLGRSALHLAVTSESSVVAKWLLDNGVDINGRDFNKRSPLMLCQSATTTAILIKRGAKVDLRDRDGRNAGHYAASRGSHEILEILLDHGIEPNSTSNSLNTLLHDAVSTVSLECVKLLCQRGALVNAVARSGHTPLHLAIETTPDIVRVLVDKASNLTIENSSVCTAVKMAIARMRSSTDGLNEARAIFESLIQSLHSTVDTEERNRDLLVQILHTCAEYGSGSCVETFFKYLGEDTRITASTRRQGVSPLHAAASKCNVDAARVLVRMPDVDVNASDDHGRTALMRLSMVLHTEQDLEAFCELIHGEGSRLDVRNTNQETAWSLALQHNNLKVLIFLLKTAPDDIVAEMLNAHAVTRDRLLAAIDANQIGLVEAFSKRVRIMPPTYDSDLMNRLAKACRSTREWTAVSRRLSYMCTHKPKDVRDVFLGHKVSKELLGIFYNFGDQVAVGSLKHKAFYKRKPFRGRGEDGEAQAYGIESDEDAWDAELSRRASAPVP